MTTILSRSLLAGAVVGGLGALWFGTQFASSPSASDGAIQAASEISKAKDPKTIVWTDLLPEGEPFVMPLNAATDFPDVKATPFASSETGGGGDMEIPFTPLPASGRQELANQFVKLAGYMTPLNVVEGKTRTFLLVPYVGACIHVPAPPANQIVLVESKKPIEVRKMWEPFQAVGTLNVETLSTQLADVSYSMDLSRIEPYVEEPTS